MSFWKPREMNLYLHVVNANTALHAEGCGPTWKGEARPAEEAGRSGLYPHLCSSRLVVNSEGSEKISTSHIHLKITFTLATGIKGIQWLFHFSQFSSGVLLSLFLCVFIFHKNSSSGEKF